MRRTCFLLLSLALLPFIHPAIATAQANNQPPSGFVAVFNGKDLAGWHGMGDFDPRKLWALSDDDRQKKRADEMKDFHEHWRVENGELVNDGKGGYATTDTDYGDIDFWIDYKTVALADSGIYLRA